LGKGAAAGVGVAARVEAGAGAGEDDNAAIRAMQNLNSTTAAAGKMFAPIPGTPTQSLSPSQCAAFPFGKKRGCCREGRPSIDSMLMHSAGVGGT